MSTLAVTITLSFSSWHLPLGITLCAIAALFMVAFWESKHTGDFGLPMFTLMTACMGFASIVTAWAVYFILR
jgi:hypothetical protein